MKLFVGMLLLILFSCSSSNDSEQKKEPINVFEIQSKRIKIDTIIEPNSPKKLDFSKHQLFVDTTRNSKYYEQILKWTSNKFDIGGVNYYLNQIKLTQKTSKIDLNDFPKKWTSIHLLNGKYVSYNPLNGIDWRLTLTDSSINYYAIESDADAFYKKIKHTDKELIIELRTCVEKNENQIEFLRIKKSNIQYLYSFQFSNSITFEETEYVSLITPIENIIEFDLVVDDAPDLLNSGIVFDKIKRINIE